MPENKPTRVTLDEPFSMDDPMSRFESLLKSVSAVKIPKAQIKSKESQDGTHIELEMFHPDTGHGMYATLERDHHADTSVHVKHFDPPIDPETRDPKNAPAVKNAFGPAMMSQLARHLLHTHGIESVSYKGKKGPKSTYIAGEVDRQQSRERKAGKTVTWRPMDEIQYNKAEDERYRSMDPNKQFAPGVKFI